jgi:hypothetical protein
VSLENTGLITLGQWKKYVADGRVDGIFLYYLSAMAEIVGMLR